MLSIQAGDSVQLNGRETVVSKTSTPYPGIRILHAFDPGLLEEASWILDCTENANTSQNQANEASFVQQQMPFRREGLTLRPVAIGTLTTIVANGRQTYTCYKLEDGYVSLQELLTLDPKLFRPKNLAYLTIAILELSNLAAVDSIDPSCLTTSNIYIERSSLLKSRGYSTPIKFAALSTSPNSSLTPSALVNSAIRISADVISTLRSLEDKVLSGNEFDILQSIDRLLTAYPALGPTSRQPGPIEIAKRIERFVKRPRHELLEVASLEEILENTNASTLEPQDQVNYFQDTEPSIREVLDSREIQFIYGRRGCGKTTLLQTFAWQFEEAARREHTLNIDITVNRKVPHLGLFASLVELTRNRRPSADEILHLLFLRYATEILKATEYQIDNGEHDPWLYFELDDFVRLLAETYESYFEITEPWTVETLHEALAQVREHVNIGLVKADQISTPNFQRLAEIARGMHPHFQNRFIFFLLDDVTTRTLPVDTLRSVLSYLIAPSKIFAFKICAEANLGRVDVFPFNHGRDYKAVDFDEYLTDVKKFEVHLQKIIDRKRNYESSVSIVERLGPNKSYNEISEAIIQAVSKSRPDSTTAPIYHGFKALARIANGNVGDALRLHRTMLERSTNSLSIDPAIQHQTFIDESNSLLDEFQRRGDSLPLDHIRAFSRAAHLELINSGRADNSRKDLRSHYRVEFPFDGHTSLSGSPIDKLVTEQIYDLGEVKPRTRDRGKTYKYTVSLDFRFILGLSYLIPIANRDRFEISESTIPEWLVHPKYSQLTEVPDHISPFKLAFSEVNTSPTPVSFSSAASNYSALSLQEPLFCEDELIELTDSEIEELRSIFPSSNLVFAAGFEDRAAGFILQELAKCSPQFHKAVSIRYPGDISGIEGADRIASNYCIQPFDLVDCPKIAKSIINGTECDNIFLDISAMSKPWIYFLSQAAVRSSLNVYIIHTSAKTYFPTDKMLKEFASPISVTHTERILGRLDALTQSEGREFDVYELAPLSSAPGKGDVVLPISLNYRRLESVIDLDFDNYLILQLEHDNKAWQNRNSAIRFIANYLTREGNCERLAAIAFSYSSSYNALNAIARRAGASPLNSLHFALTGSKMNTLAMGTFSARNRITGVWYPNPTERDHSSYTRGIGPIRIFKLVRLQ